MGCFGLRRGFFSSSGDDPDNCGNFSCVRHRKFFGFFQSQIQSLEEWIRFCHSAIRAISDQMTYNWDICCKKNLAARFTEIRSALKKYASQCITRTSRDEIQQKVVVWNPIQIRELMLHQWNSQTQEIVRSLEYPCIVDMSSLISSSSLIFSGFLRFVELQRSSCLHRIPAFLAKRTRISPVLRGLSVFILSSKGSRYPRSLDRPWSG